MSAITTTTFTMWDGSAYGDADTVTVATGNKVMVMVSVQLAKSDTNASNLIYYDVVPCYTTGGSITPVLAPLNGRSRGIMTSTGTSDVNTVAAAYKWTGLAAGSYHFSVCMARASTSTSYSSFIGSAPKVSVLVYN